jgi:hypothetical protein
LLFVLLCFYKLVARLFEPFLRAKLFPAQSLNIQARGLERAVIVIGGQVFESRLGAGKFGFDWRQLVFSRSDKSLCGFNGVHLSRRVLFGFHAILLCE